MFWDSSALVPYLIHENRSGDMTVRLQADLAVVMWWATPVECVSAIERRRRDPQSTLPAHVFREARRRLDALLPSVDQVQPTAGVRGLAIELLERHVLRAMDALQLAAALSVRSAERPEQMPFACLDERLRTAALQEGLALVP